METHFFLPVATECFFSNTCISAKERTKARSDCFVYPRVFGTFKQDVYETKKGNQYRNGIVEDVII